MMSMPIDGQSRIIEGEIAEMCLNSKRLLRYFINYLILAYLQREINRHTNNSFYFQLLTKYWLKSQYRPLNHGIQTQVQIKRRFVFIIHSDLLLYPLIAVKIRYLFDD